jgi:hypothetical protein
MLRRTVKSHGLPQMGQGRSRSTQEKQCRPQGPMGFHQARWLLQALRDGEQFLD